MLSPKQQIQETAASGSGLFSTLHQVRGCGPFEFGQKFQRKVFVIYHQGGRVSESWVAANPLQWYLRSPAWNWSCWSHVVMVIGTRSWNKPRTDVIPLRVESSMLQWHDLVVHFFTLMSVVVVQSWACMVVLSWKQTAEIWSMDRMWEILTGTHESSSKNLFGTKSVACVVKKSVGVIIQVTLELAVSLITENLHRHGIIQC